MCFELPRLHVQHLPSSEESCRSKAEEAKSLQVAIMSIPVSHKSQPLQSAVPPKASIVRTRRSCRKRAMKRDLPRIRISSFVTMWWLMAVASRRFREMGFNMIKSGGFTKASGRQFGGGIPSRHLVLASATMSGSSGKLLAACRSTLKDSEAMWSTYTRQCLPGPTAYSSLSGFGAPAFGSDPMAHRSLGLHLAPQRHCCQIDALIEVCAFGGQFRKHGVRSSRAATSLQTIRCLRERYHQGQTKVVCTVCRST